MASVERTLSMHAEVDRMLADHVARTPGASPSSTVNAPVIEYLEASALRTYVRWDAAAGPEELAALDAYNSQP
jgi:hypothetical protein